MNKILRSNLSKETKDLFVENCQMLMKEIKDNTDRREIYFVFGLEDSILSK